MNIIYIEQSVSMQCSLSPQCPRKCMHVVDVCRLEYVQPYCTSFVYARFHCVSNDDIRNGKMAKTIVCCGWSVFGSCDAQSLTRYPLCFSLSLCFSFVYLYICIYGFSYAGRFYHFRRRYESVSVRFWGKSQSQHPHRAQKMQHAIAATAFDDHLNVHSISI